jgi:hypothetical protein
MMIQYFTNEGENAFSIQAPRVQKFKKKAALGKLLKIIFLRITIAVDSRTRTRQTLWSSFVEVAILCITIIGLGGYGV